jgi:hypothetical protein
MKAVDTMKRAPLPHGHTSNAGGCSSGERIQMTVGEGCRHAPKSIAARVSAHPFAARYAWNDTAQEPV